MMTASRNRRYSGHHKATEEEGDQGKESKEIWRKKCGQLEEDGGGSTRQSWMETSGLWPVYVPLGATRHKPNVYTFTLTVSCINYVFLPRDASAERGYEIAYRLSVCL